MGSITVVTTFSRKGYEVYGQRMLDSFNKFWPKDIPLYVYYEGDEEYTDDEEELLKWYWTPLDDDEDRAAFMARHTDHPVDYRRQPIKFCHKVFAVTAAPRETDFLIWLDGDIETKAPVTHAFLDSVLPDDCVATYMGREWWQHTESGFVAYNCATKSGREFLDDMRLWYTHDAVIDLPQQHDCMVFDGLRKIYEQRGHKFNDLGKDYRGEGLAVMPHTPLGTVMKHNKGNKQKREAYGAVA